MSEVKISALVIAKNEEKSIGRCLNSVKWTFERIVVDNGSSDKTYLISKKLGARVYVRRKRGFSYLRNEGLKLCRGDWILYVDADEEVSEKLKKEILEKTKISELGHQKFVAYAIPRENYVFGKLLKHGGWWPDYVKRLFKKDKFKGFIGELHEEPVFEGKIGLLKNPLIHYKEETLEEMVEKTNSWSEIEARLMYKNNHPKMNILRFLSAVFREFWFRFVKNKAFLDGEEGLIFAYYQLYSKFTTYAKLWEMQIKQSQRRL